MKQYIQYAQQVISGEIVACELIRLACERFFSLMDIYEFREDVVDDKIRFYAILKHFKSRHSGKPFILEPWQQWIIASVYGFFNKDGTRLTQTAYIEIARKNGKTALAAGMGLDGLINDGEDGAEIYFAANSRDQVKISAWPLCSNFATGLDPKGKLLTVYRDTVKFDATKSFLKVLASDSTKLDGPDPHMFILDEYHAAKTNSVKAVLESGQGNRENPLAIIITTAGFDKLGPCYELRDTAVDILHNLKEDDSFFCAVFTLDKDDDWKDPAMWIKSNPNLNVTVRPQYLRKEIRKAINTPSDEVNVKTKNLNIWCDSSEVWIPDSYIIEASKDIRLEDFKDVEAYAGIDLSSTSDLTCVNYMIPQDDKFYFLTKYYLPQAALTEKRFRETYSEWRRLGLLTLTPGNVTDYDYILNDLMEAHNLLFLSSVAYDPWNATQFVINATEKGINMAPYGQNLGNFNRPTKELERIILSGRAVIDNNIITRHCFRNVVMARDNNGNVKPSKKFEEKKIDGVIAMLESLGSYLSNPRYSATI